MGIGKRLNQLMKEKNTNANELAQKIGVTPSTLYSMVQRDSNRVDIDLIIKIAHALGITADELLSEDGEGYYTNTKTATLAEQMKNSEEMRMLFDEARDAEPEDIKALYDMLLVLKRKERRYDD